MGGERNVLLRRTTPLAIGAVLVLLAPAAGRASSFSPDPPPGSSRLRPDPAPFAPAVPQRSLPAPARRVAAPLPAPVRAVTTPVTRRRASRPSAPRPRQHSGARLALPKLELPPVVVPAFVSTPLRSRSEAGLAAVALALAALTAGSGAGLVRAWSRR
jgi:hypothetical protein